MEFACEMLSKQTYRVKGSAIRPSQGICAAFIGGWTPYGMPVFHVTAAKLGSIASLASIMHYTAASRGFRTLPVSKFYGAAR
jgi:hypothetical protein